MLFTPSLSIGHIRVLNPLSSLTSPILHHSANSLTLSSFHSSAHSHSLSPSVHNLHSSPSFRSLTSSNIFPPNFSSICSLSISHSPSPSPSTSFFPLTPISHFHHGNQNHNHFTKSFSIQSKVPIPSIISASFSSHSSSSPTLSPTLSSSSSSSPSFPSSPSPSPSRPIRSFLQSFKFILRSLPRTLAKLFFGSLAVALIFDFFSDHSLIRLLRTFIVMGVIAIDYKLNYPTSEEREKSEEKRNISNEVHTRCAIRFAWLCDQNAGLYIKVAQYISSMNHALPTPWLTQLSKFKDHAPYVSFDTIRVVIEKELGCPIKDIFEEFDEIPVASASIAQVHKAVIRDDISFVNHLSLSSSLSSRDARTVAVKIQYPGLIESFRIDMFAQAVVLYLGEKFFKDFKLVWMQNETEPNLRNELDFRQEARNAERADKLFQYVDKITNNNSKIYVPKIHWKFTSQRVLTMEWIDGFRINDNEKLALNHIDKKEIVTNTIRALSSQIFVTGFVHCDPHIGNIIIRPTHNNSSYQIVLLDHGLYRQLRHSVRILYCNLWKSLIIHNDEDVELSCKALGVVGKDAEREYLLSNGMESDDGKIPSPPSPSDSILSIPDWQLFSLSILMRPYGNSAGFSTMLSKAEIKKLRIQLENKVADSLSLLEMMPRELLLALRNQNYLRSLNVELGMPINRFRVMAREALRGLEFTPLMDKEEIEAQENAEQIAKREEKFSVQRLKNKGKYVEFAVRMNSRIHFYSQISKIQHKIDEKVHLYDDLQSTSVWNPLHWIKYFVWWTKTGWREWREVTQVEWGLLRADIYNSLAQFYITYIRADIGKELLDMERQSLQIHGDGDGIGEGEKEKEKEKFKEKEADNHINSTKDRAKETPDVLPSFSPSSSSPSIRGEDISQLVNDLVPPSLNGEMSKGVLAR